MSLYRAVGRAWTGRRHTGNGGRRSGIHVTGIHIVIHVALGAVLAAATVCTCGSVARAGDYDDPSGQSFGTRVLHAIGLPDPDHPEYEINYSERSPLVVPPNRNLPAPIATDRPPAPNWPQDPDFKKRQAAKDEKIVPQGDRVIEEGRPLRPDELISKGTRASAASSSGGIEPKKSGLLNFGWFKKEEYGTFTGEPPRANLTDPPPGYQTPSPDQPYGIPPERKAYKPKTLGERMEPVR
ncbi:MAG: hypothetical protein WBD11_17125 [Xanthobacteraceae bacterium]